MKIKQIKIYKTNLPYVGGIYEWGNGNKLKVTTKISANQSLSTSNNNV